MHDGSCLVIAVMPQAAEAALCLVAAAILAAQQQKWSAA